MLTIREKAPLPSPPRGEASIGQAQEQGKVAPSPPLGEWEGGFAQNVHLPEVDVGTKPLSIPASYTQGLFRDVDGINVGFGMHQGQCDGDAATASADVEDGGREG